MSEPEYNKLAELPKLPAYTPIPAIHDGAYSSPRAVIAEDGSEMLLPPQPFEWWLDGDGNLTALVVTTNVCGAEPESQNLERRVGGFKHPDFDHRYHKQITDERRAKKWLKIDEHPAEHILEELNARRARVAKRSQKYTDASMSSTDVLRQAMEGQTKSIDKLVGAIAKEMAKDERRAAKGKE